MPEHKKAKGETLDRWLSRGGIAVSIISSQIPRTPVSIAISMVVVFALLAHPIWKLPWAKAAMWRRLACMSLLAFAVIVLGYLLLPERPDISIELVYRQNPSLLLVNSSNSTVKDAKYPRQPTPRREW